MHPTCFCNVLGIRKQTCCQQSISRMKGKRKKKKKEEEVVIIEPHIKKPMFPLYDICISIWRGHLYSQDNC